MIMLYPYIHKYVTEAVLAVGIRKKFMIESAGGYKKG